MRSRPIRRTALLAAAFAVTVATLSTPVAADPASPAPSAVPRGCTSDGAFEVCLTDPGQFSDNRDTAIVDRLRELVQSTSDGDAIRIALYTWTLTGLAGDVVDAHERGVDVRVVLDGKSADHRPYELLTEAGVPVEVCVDSCLSTHINHNKFFLFDIDGTRSIAQSSSNITATQLGLYNNLIRITGDDRLYDYFLAYWNRLNAQSWTYDGVTWTQDDLHRLGTLATKGYFYPRATGDNVLGILNNITSCSQDGDGDADGDRKIWVSASLFSSSRERVRNRLAQLEDRLGCNVKVIVQRPAQERWAQVTTSGGYNLANHKVRHTNNHNKTMVVDAKYNGRWQEVVFTGSHNLNGNSLRNNDDALVRVENQFVYGQYRAYFDGMYAGANNS